MPHKSIVASALRGAFRDGYTSQHFLADLQAGVVVGLVATPLCMGLAIATGVPPWLGLVTASVGGLVAAVFGGSRYQVSGPTAAFIVILVPILKAHGIGGLAFAGFLAGLILVLMAYLGLGRLIAKIPHSVVVGFTLGIATVIALLQIRDAVGYRAPGVFALPDAALGISTFLALFVCKYFKFRIPPPLLVLPVAQTGATLFNKYNPAGAADVTTIFSRFGQIPHGLPSFHFPWEALGETAWYSLLGPAIAIALLGAIESLLAAVAGDTMAQARGQRAHNSDGELFGIGLANIAVACFGSIAATGAIARTSTNIRFGGKTPVAAIIHALLIFGVCFALGPAVSLLPTSALAALLLYVALHMAEPHEIRKIFQSAKFRDIAAFLVSAILTLTHDMVVGVGAGVATHFVLGLRQKRARER